MAVTGSITSTPNITLVGGGTYDVIQDSLVVGQMTWRREVVTSPYVHGDVEVASVRAAGQVALTVRVTAADQSSLQTAINNLIAAVSASSFTLSVSLDGTAYTWTCGRASYSVTFDVGMYRGKRARVALVVPRHPVAVAGPI